MTRVEGQVDVPFLAAVKEVVRAGSEGVVVIGRVERGVVTVGDTAEIVGMERRTKLATIVALTMFHRSCRAVVGGDPGVTFVLQGVDVDGIAPGQVLCSPGSIQAHRRFRGSVRVLTEDNGGRPIANHHQARFFFRTAIVNGDLAVLDGTDVLQPGDEREIQVTLDLPVGLDKTTHFDIRGERGPFDRMAVGKVTDLLSLD